MRIGAIMTLVWFSLNSLLLLFLLLRIDVESSPDPCLLRCKDNYMLRMRSEWSLDFLLPIVSVLKTSKNDNIAYSLAVDICNCNRRFEFCLSSCQGSSRKTILLLGLLPWKHICDNEYEYLKDLLPCWVVNADILMNSCTSETRQLLFLMHDLALLKNFKTVRQMSNSICTQMYRYFMCTMNDHEQICGSLSAKFVVNVSKVTNDVIVKMVQLSSTDDQFTPFCHSFNLLSFHNVKLQQRRYLDQLTNRTGIIRDSALILIVILSVIST